MKLPFTLTTVVGIVAVIVVLIIASVGYYNSFIIQTNAIEGQWKQVEVQYQRRYDLIPNLVESVKGLQKQEQKIFGDVNAARIQYAGAQTPETKVQAANQLEGTLSRLFAVFENYPQIKSDQAVLKLQDELAGTENRIAVERRRYNELVQQYNTSATTLPGKLFAGVFGFSTKTYFQSVQDSENVPKVQFP
ncbi:LemA family protein [Candidatus Daviesbacteria bacterium]|nr:LemA family protein [Candidatus Daviesbacteria bacterium]